MRDSTAGAGQPATGLSGHFLMENRTPGGRHRLSLAPGRRSASGAGDGADVPQHRISSGPTRLHARVVRRSAGVNVTRRAQNTTNRPSITDGLPPSRLCGHGECEAIEDVWLAKANSRLRKTRRCRSASADFTLTARKSRPAPSVEPWLSRPLCPILPSAAQTSKIDPVTCFMTIFYNLSGYSIANPTNRPAVIFSAPLA